MIMRDRRKKKISFFPWAVMAVTVAMPVALIMGARGAMLEHYAESPECRDLVSNSVDGRVYVARRNTPEIVLELLDDELLDPCEEYPERDMTQDGAWYRIDASLVNRCREEAEKTKT